MSLSDYGCVGIKTELPVADELYRLSSAKQEQIIQDIIRGLEDHILVRMIEEAKKGNTYYIKTIDRCHPLCKESLLRELLKIAHNLERLGYAVFITDYGNGGGYPLLNFTVSWGNDKYRKRYGFGFEGEEVVYETSESEEDENE